jgi:hypothetical protein
MKKGIKMFVLNERMYVLGTVDISAEALRKLASLGVNPRKNPFPQGGGYLSFYLPFGQDGEEFVHTPGAPGWAGDLYLKTEG